MSHWFSVPPNSARRDCRCPSQPPLNYRTEEDCNNGRGIPARFLDQAESLTDGEFYDGLAIAHLKSMALIALQNQPRTQHARGTRADRIDSRSFEEMKSSAALVSMERLPRRWQQVPQLFSAPPNSARLEHCWLAFGNESFVFVRTIRARNIPKQTASRNLSKILCTPNFHFFVFNSKQLCDINVIII